MHIKKVNKSNITRPPRELFKIEHPLNDLYHEHTYKELLKLHRGVYLMEEWWKKKNVRVNYHINEYNQYYLSGLEELAELTRKFHHMIAPQQNWDNHLLIFGVGATQLLHAAIYALTVLHAKRSSKPGFINATPLYFTHQIPGYLETKDLIEAFDELSARWIPVQSAHLIDENDLVEFVTSPNNPDGALIYPVTRAKHIVHDRVNWWPCYMTDNLLDFKNNKLEEDELSIWSLPKILSFSGSRVGYAFVKNAKVAHYMQHFIITTTHGLAVDGQIRCLTALRYLINKGRAHEYMDWLTAQLSARWQALTKIISQTRLTLLNHAGPAAWVETAGNAQEELYDHYRIIGTYGPEYGVDDRFARLNLLCTSDQFAELIWRLQNPFK